MIGGQEFRNDKTFKNVVARIERKTSPANREELVGKALKTKYFTTNNVAAKALLHILNLDTSDDKYSKSGIKQVFGQSGQQPINPEVVAIKGESILDLGRRLVENYEYTRAIDLYLSDENIGQYWQYAWPIAKRYLKNEKDMTMVANSIFEYCKKNPETARTFAECAKHLWPDSENIAKDIIIKWTQKIIGKRGSDHNKGFKTIGQDIKEVTKKTNYFWWVKKLLKFLDTIQTNITLEFTSIDTSVCFELLYWMAILWWCNQEIQGLFTVWNKFHHETDEENNIRVMIHEIYAESLAV